MVLPAALLMCLGLCGLISAQSDEECKYTFHVWRPEEDVLQTLRTLQLKLDNVTSHISQEIISMKLKQMEDLSIYRNWTMDLERDMATIHVKEAKRKGDLRLLNNRVDYIGKQLESERERLTDIARQVRILSSEQSMNAPQAIRAGGKYVRETNYDQMLENTVSDLKAEWMLMKREINYLDTASDDILKKFRKLQNETNSIKSSAVNVSSTAAEMEMKINGVNFKNEKLTNSINSLGEDLVRIKSNHNTLNAIVQKLNDEVNSLHILYDDVRRDMRVIQSVSAQTISGKAMNDGRFDSMEDIKGRDCHDLYVLGYRTSGVYEILPKGASQMLYVYCLMSNKTGHTVFQRRVDGLSNFNRRWLEYKFGFGNLYGEFWLGNENLHRLTSQRKYALRVELWDWEGNRYFAEYRIFRVGSEKRAYRLKVGEYSGNAGDSMTHHDGVAFSTDDVDNDNHPRNCAAENKGGWWYYSCYTCNLNGVYHRAWYAQTQSTFADGIVWYTLKESEFYSLQKVEMMLKPGW